MSRTDEGQTTEEARRNPEGYNVDGMHDRSRGLQSALSTRISGGRPVRTHLALVDFSGTHQTPVHLLRLLTKELVVRIVLRMNWYGVALNPARVVRKVHENLHSREVSSLYEEFHSKNSLVRRVSRGAGSGRRRQLPSLLQLRHARRLRSQTFPMACSIHRLPLESPRPGLRNMI